MCYCISICKQLRGRVSHLLTLSSLILILLVSGACGNSIQKKNYGVPPNFVIDAATTIDYLTVYYYSLSTCVKCHRDRVAPEISTYETLVNHISDVQSVVAGGEMPPTGDGYASLTACQLLVLNTWVNRGMPKSGGSSLGTSGNACY